MSDAPERIWIEGAVSDRVWEYDKQSCLSPHEYIRADAAEAKLAAQWQPIETAPKDGTRIILYGKYWSDGQGWFTEGKPGFFCYIQSEWVASGLNSAGNFKVRPTHWMPLPAPPALIPKEGEK